jgi:AAA15 family ATPase/GTPase
MLQTITINNFKSIVKDTIDLGGVNVFIGENGCGKSNILEAVGFASLAEKYGSIDTDILNINGIRVAKPSLMMAAFKGKKQGKEIRIDFVSMNSTKSTIVIPEEKNNIYSKWEITGFSFSNNEFMGQIKLLIDNKINEDEFYKKLLHLSSQNNFKNSPDFDFLTNYVIYTLNTQALRGIPEFLHSRKGLHGETLDTLIADLDQTELAALKSYTYFIDWLDDFFIDSTDQLKHKGYKLNQSKSLLYFKDKLMLKADNNNVFSTENANEGVLHVLFYLATLISKNSPKFFAIDNIETALNPHLCRVLMGEICKLAKIYDKQLLITTHNPAILDGLNLFDPEIRLFEVKRLENGQTKTRRITVKPNIKNEMGEMYKMSELWTRGFLGAISQQY